MPEGPPHLALNPPFFVGVFLFSFFSLSFLCFYKKMFFPLEKCIYCLFLSVSQPFFGLPLFQLLFLCLSLLLFFALLVHMQLECVL